MVLSSLSMVLVHLWSVCVRKGEKLLHALSTVPEARVSSWERRLMIGQLPRVAHLISWMHARMRARTHQQAWFCTFKTYTQTVKHTSIKDLNHYYFLLETFQSFHSTRANQGKRHARGQNHSTANMDTTLLPLPSLLPPTSRVRLWSAVIISTIVRKDK